MQLVLKILLAIIILAILGVGITAFVLDKDYDHTSSTSIKGTPEEVHAYVGDLRRWSEWTVFEERDETVKVTLGDQDKGVGASYSWTSDSADGKLTFTKSDPKVGVEFTMETEKAGEKYPPMYGVISYKPDGEMTKVSWQAKGEMEGVFGGLMAAIIGGAIGPLFDANLEKLKTKVESKP